MRQPQREINADSKGKDPFAFEETRFRIGDEAIIMSIFSDRMYSNPIRIICQEIASNARDAHREVNKDDVPIEISLPLRSDSFLHIRDYGIGITPQRMKDVFVAYGLSTKRSDDSQTGGFGLGAKSPWSYTDWFEIACITYDETVGCNIKRLYRAYKDEQGIGRLALKDECNTEEDTGTEYIIPVKAGEDWQTFAHEMASVTNYWKVNGGGVMPRISHQNDFFKWFDIEKYVVYQDAGWAVLNKTAFPYRCNEPASPIAIVDGIPYTINIQSLKIVEGQVNHNKDNERILNLSELAIRLYFATGEIDLSATRETINYNTKTVEMILFRFNNCIDYMTNFVKQQIDKCQNLWQANVRYASLMQKLSGVFPITYLSEEWKWQTYTVRSQGIDIVTGSSYDIASSWGVRLYEVCRGKSDMAKYDATVPVDGLGVEKGRAIYFREDAYLAIDDIGKGRVNKPRVRTIFNENPWLKRLYVLVLGNCRYKDFMARMDQDYSLSAMNPLFLSQIEPTRQKRENTGPRKKRDVQTSKVFQYDDNYHDRWRPVIIDLATTNGIYVVKHYSKLYDGFEQETRAPWDISKYAAKYGITVYAVLSSQKDKIGSGWVKLRTFLKAKYKELMVDPTIEQLAKEHVHLTNHTLDFTLQTDIGLLNMLIPSIDVNHVMIQYANYVAEIKKKEDDMEFFCELRQVATGEIASSLKLSHKDSKVFQLRQSILDKYPLLALMQSYTSSVMYKKICEYILAVDKGVL